MYEGGGADRRRPGLWQFSVALYQKPGMESLCLQLQDGFGVNVNSLLWCCWLDACGAPVEADLLRRAERRLWLWRRLWVTPLRTLRRQLPRSGALGRLRRRVKALELGAERRELLWLQGYSGARCPNPAPPVQRADVRRGNLALLLQRHSLQDSAPAQALNRVLQTG